MSEHNWGEDWPGMSDPPPSELPDSEHERRKLPDPTGPGSYEGAPSFQGVRAMFQPEGYDVYSHSDDPVPGRTPPNAVALVIWLRFEGDKIGIAMRFKSREGVDQLIDCLERHAVDVWPKGQPGKSGA